MQDLPDLCASAAKVQATPARLFLASVVQVNGPAYRHPGARLLFSDEGPLAGAVSGGCLERDIIQSSAWAVRNGPLVRRYDARRDEDSAVTVGTGCGGVVDVLIEALSLGAPEDPIAFIRRCLATEQRGVIVTVYRSQSLAAPVGARLFYSESEGATCHGLESEALVHELSLRAALTLREFTTHNYRAADGAVEVLIERIEPPPHLFIFGSGSDVLPIIQLAGLLRWNLTVFAVRARPLLRDRFHGLARLIEADLELAIAQLNRCARGLALVCAHDFQSDRSALLALLQSRALYIGALGPRERSERMLHNTGLLGSALQGLKRLHAPCGLHLGGESATEIALSIVSEAQAVLHNASCVPLRGRRKIHEAQSVRASLHDAALELVSGAE